MNTDQELHCSSVLIRISLSGCGKNGLFCHSERSEESLFDLSLRKEREIPRSARNDKMMEGLFPQPVQPVWSRSCLDLNPQAEACATVSAAQFRRPVRRLHLFGAYP